MRSRRRQLGWRAHGKRMGTREHMLEAERRWAAEKVRRRGRRWGRRGWRADAEAGRAHGGGGEGPVTLVCRGSSCLRRNAKHRNIHVSSQMTQGDGLCGQPRRYGSRGQWGLWKGQPRPALRNRTTAFSTSVSCIHRSLLLCTPRRSRTELSWPTSLPQCSTRPHCSVRRLLAWVPPPVLWPAPLLCA